MREERGTKEKEYRKEREEIDVGERQLERESVCVLEG